MKTFNIFLIYTIVFLLVSGCKGEKGETPPQVPAGRQTAEVPPAPEMSEGSAVKAPSEEITVTVLVDENSKPEVISIKLSPKLVYPGTKIKAEVEGHDRDGDAVTFTYEWKRNGTIIENTALNELDTADFKKGDLIILFVTPFDGKEKGKTRWSITVMIANRPPEINSLPPITVSNGRYIYEVKAADADGDTLTFSLEDAPPGMSIDSVTGVIQWDIPAEAGASYRFTVVVSDGDAKAYQGITLKPRVEIQEKSPASPFDKGGSRNVG